MVLVGMSIMNGLGWSGNVFFLSMATTTMHLIHQDGWWMGLEATAFSFFGGSLPSIVD